MPVDRDQPVRLFAPVPKLMADVEPVPRELDHLLDDEEIVHRITTDPARRTALMAGGSAWARVG